MAKHTTSAANQPILSDNLWPSKRPQRQNTPSYRQNILAYQTTYGQTNNFIGKTSQLIGPPMTRQTTVSEKHAILSDHRCKTNNDISKTDTDYTDGRTDGHGVDVGLHHTLKWVSPLGLGYDWMIFAMATYP